MGRRPKYANLEEAYRGKNARRRERRANASTMDNSGTAATTQFRVSIKESFNSRSTMELRYKDKTYQLAQQDATRQRRRKRLAMDPLRIIATEPDILPDIPDCQHVKQRNFI
nr:uncharacterized protein LOC113723732 isoform X2 [Coffea arabica]XP_027102514.1 uncharacterized protein LOC113723737 isoform X2 [Coffea arabica]